MLPGLTQCHQSCDMLGRVSCSTRQGGREAGGAARITATAGRFSCTGFWEQETTQKPPPKKIYHPSTHQQTCKEWMRNGTRWWMRYL